MSLARADLESLLRTRRLDRTLTTMLPGLPGLPAPPEAGERAAADEYAVAPTGVTSLDQCLGGGLPRGQLSELVGPRSSGRTSLLMSMLAAATRRGERVALVDALDMFDLESAAAAGVVCDRMLWIRGHVAMSPGRCRETNQRALEHTIRALALVLQAGHFGMVAFDAGDVPVEAVRGLPFTTWLRLQRMVAGSTTVGLLVGSEPMARSAAGLTLSLTARRAGVRFGTRLFEGIDVDARVISARRGVRPRGHGSVPVPDTVSFSTVAGHV